MKNILNISLVIVCILLASCHNNDDDTIKNQSNNIENDIIGKWVPYEIIVNNNKIDYDDHEACGFDYLQFNKDLTYKYVDIFDCREEIENGTYAIHAKDNKISIRVGVLIKEGFVRIFTSPNKVLSIEFIYDYDEDGKEDSVVTRYNYELINKK